MSGVSTGRSDDCDFCGLPVYADEPSPGPHYCCYGCRFAASVSAADGAEGQARWAMTRLGFAVFLSMNVMVFTMLLWAQETQRDPGIAAVGAPTAEEIWFDLGRYACFLFTAPVVMLLGGPLVEDARDELRRGKASLSLLLLVGVAAALGYSMHSLAVGGHVYFEVACTILVAVTLGRWFEATGKLKTTEALRSLEKLLPDTVRRVRDGVEESISPAQLIVGDDVRVLPGERIPTDGVVMNGDAAVDEQTVTGESAPPYKRTGDSVFSGTLVLDGPLIVRATAAAGEGALARMITAMQTAAAGRTQFERTAERISRWFLPIVAVVAVLTFAAHTAVAGVGAGILAAVAVLVIACPCALGLATPMALWAAVGRAAQAGILIRDADALSLLAQIRTACFDKTGTLTTGEARVTEFAVADETDRVQALRAAAVLAAGTTHPLASAVARFVAARGETASPAMNVREFPGRGVSAEIDGLGVTFLGSRRWLTECGLAGDFPDSDDGAETLLGWGGKIRGRFALQESIRAGAKETIAVLGRTGIRAVMLTGDRRRRADVLSASLGLESVAQLLPEEKPENIRRFRSDGAVLMVGDGINDAPALAAADVGIALGSGSDISRHAAGICLLGNDLTRLPWLLRLSGRTVHTIRWNLIWAFAYNILGIGAAAAGWLHPIMAAIAMGVSSLFVVGNSLNLASFPLDESPKLMPQSDGKSAHSKPSVGTAA